MQNKYKDVFGLIGFFVAVAFIFGGLAALQGDSFNEVFIFVVTNLPLLVGTCLAGAALGVFVGSRMGSEVAGAIIGGIGAPLILYPVLSDLLSKWLE